MLAKPQAFMNVSGGAGRQAGAEYDAEPEDLIVVHDDIDLAPGRVLCKRGGGHGGHNGLRSLTRSSAPTPTCGCASAWAARPGAWIRPTTCSQRLRGDSLEELEAAVPTAAQAVMHILEHGIETPCGSTTRTEVAVGSG